MGGGGSRDEDREDEGDGSGDDNGSVGIDVGGRGKADATCSEYKMENSCWRTKPAVPTIPLALVSFPSQPRMLVSPAFSSPLRRREGSFFSFSAKATIKGGGENATPIEVDRRPLHFSIRATA